MWQLQIFPTIFNNKKKFNQEIYIQKSPDKFIYFLISIIPMNTIIFKCIFMLLAIQKHHTCLILYKVTFVQKQTKSQRFKATILECILYLSTNQQELYKMDLI